jgi:hypothetical protein
LVAERHTTFRCGKHLLYIIAETAVVCPIGIDTTVYQYAEYRLPVHLARDEVTAVGFFILQQRF